MPRRAWTLTARSKSRRRFRFRSPAGRATTWADLKIPALANCLFSALAGTPWHFQSRRISSDNSSDSQPIFGNFEALFA
jgi:hypothetical protein